MSDVFNNVDYIKNIKKEKKKSLAIIQTRAMAPCATLVSA